ncbi:hypothetical protein BC628DRAFT_1421356 [Trametes gibbosa]|nr:hypothetical protein BC628DRAFT_1421356 [Trametes gibbosa]
MSLLSGADSSNARPKASPSALGFLSRGIRSVSSFVGNIFSSSVSPALVPSAYEDVTPETPRDSEFQASQEAHARLGESSPSEDGSTGNLSLAVGSSEDDSSARSSSVEEHAIGENALVAAPSNGTLALMSTSSESDQGMSAATSSGMSSSRLRALPATPARAQLPTVQAPRRRGVLRREPVYIEGQDPRDVTPASQLRGRDPRTIRENRYWRDAWGPLPTMWDIHPATGRPSAPMIIEWLARRYGRYTDPFWQAADHIFPLPDGTEFQPRFTRILRTSMWRTQDADWEAGVAPVDRVYEPARADDAADSGAEEESVGYVSDDDDMELDDASATEAGPSSTELLPVSGVSSSSRRSTSSAALPASSPGAGPSTRPCVSRKRARDSGSDAERPTTFSPERPATRRRLDPGPSTAVVACCIPRTRPRLASHVPRLSPRNATFVPHPRPTQPRRNRRARAANVAEPSTARPSHQQDPQEPPVEPTPSSSAEHHSSTFNRVPASLSHTPPLPGPRRSPRRSSPRQQGATSASGISGGVLSALPATPSERVLRPRKRQRGDDEESGSRSGDKHPSGGDERGRKRSRKH